MADNIPSFKIGANYYTATQIVDKSLYARKALTRIDVSSSGYSVNVSIAKGSFVGKIYSWTTLNGQLYFTLYGNYPMQNLVAYDSTSFSESALEAQGALSIEEEAAAKAEAEANANKSALEKFLDSLGLAGIGKTIAFAIPILVFGTLGVKLYGELNKAKSLKK